jgi:hypothetical protein
MDGHQTFAARDASKANGKLVEKVDSVMLAASDYSPNEMKPRAEATFFPRHDRGNRRALGYERASTTTEAWP